MLPASLQKLLLSTRSESNKSVLQALLLQFSSQWQQCNPSAASHDPAHSSSSLAGHDSSTHTSNSSSGAHPWLRALHRQLQWRQSAAVAIAADSSAASSWSSGGWSRCISSTARARGAIRPGNSTNGSGSSWTGSSEYSGSASLSNNIRDWGTEGGSRKGRASSISRDATPSSSSRQSSRKRSSVQYAGSGGEAGTRGNNPKRPRISTGQLSSPGKRQINARIMQEIKHSSMVQQLQQLVAQHSHDMDYISIAAAISKLPKLLGAQGLWQQQGHRQPDRLQLLHQLWQLLQPKLLACEQRELANIVWASSKLESESVQLYEACVQLFLKGIDAATARELSNVLYALCTAPAAIRQPYQAAVQQQLVPAFVKKLSDANPQDISNVLYGPAVSGLQLEAGHVQQLLTAFVCKLNSATPQAVSNTLWAVATMEQPVPIGQLRQLLDALVGMLDRVHPQDVSNTLLGVAKMGQQVLQGQLEQLLNALIGMLDRVTPQAVSNTLWAVAKMGQRVQQGQVQQLLDAFASMQHQAKHQEVANTVWACAKLGWLPQQLLAAPQLTAMLPQANAQDLANTAWACGELGHADEQLMRTLLEVAVQRLARGGSNHGFVAQGLCNMCWSVAVLNLQQYAHWLLPLVQACSRQVWNSMAAENLQQLQQVHTWMLDFGLAGGNGLQGSLTAEQLQQCRAAGDASMVEVAQAAAASNLQCAVFTALQQLPTAWQQPPQIEQVSLGSDGQPDGALLVDIAGRTASGQLVAVEADGPTHFRRPDGGLKGPHCTGTGPWQ